MSISTHTHTRTRTHTPTPYKAAGHNVMPDRSAYLNILNVIIVLMGAHAFCSEMTLQSTAPLCWPFISYC